MLSKSSGRALTPAERVAAYLMAPVLYRRSLPGATTSFFGRVAALMKPKASLLGQDVSRFVADYAGRWHDQLPTVQEYAAACTAFLLQGETVEAMTARADQLAERITTALNDVYRLKDAAAVVDTTSVTAPQLRFADAKHRALNTVLDGSARVAVKRYDITSELRNPTDAEAARTIVDIVTDMVITSGAYNRLVLSYNHTITPHFAFQVDQFSGPVIDKATTNKNALTGERVSFTFKPRSLAQYVVAERADYTLYELLAGKTPAEIQARLDLDSLGCVLFQTIFSQSAVWHVMGGLHNDFHVSNIMVRTTDAAEAYANVDLVYVSEPWRDAAGKSRHFMLPKSAHRNLFVEIIDAGRSRAFVAAKEAPGREPLVLVGNPMWTSSGIYVDSERADRSLDMRRLGIELIAHAPLADLGVRGSVNSSEANGMRRLVKHAAAVMANAPYLVAVANGLLARPQYAQNAAAQTFRVQYPKLARDFLNKARVPLTLRDAYKFAKPDVMEPLYDALAALVKDYNVLSDLFTVTIWSPSYKLDHIGGDPTAVAVIPQLSTRDNGLHASYILTLPLFEEFALERVTAADLANMPAGTVLTGVVEYEDMLAAPYAGRARDAPVETAARLAHRLATRSCYVCGHAGTGMLVSTNDTLIALPAGQVPAFCGHHCAHLHELLVAQRA